MPVLRAVGVAFGLWLVSFVVAWVFVIIGAVAAGPGLSRMNMVLSILAISVGLLFVVSAVAYYYLGARGLDAGWPRVLAVVLYVVLMVATYGVTGLLTLVILNR